VGHEHDLAAHGGIGRGFERGKRVEPDDLANNPFGRGRRAVAERGDHQFLREWGEDLDRFRAPGPSRHVERLDPHVGETHRRQLAHRPVARPRLGLGSGETLADLGRQALDHLPRVMIVGERIVAQRRDARIDQHRRWRRGGRCLGGGGSDGGQQRREERRFHRA
jgi:hypothetical protein